LDCHVTEKKTRVTNNFQNGFLLRLAMFVSVLRNQARIALVLSKPRLFITSQRAFKTLSIPRLLPTFQEPRRSYYENALNRQSEENTFRKTNPPSATLWVGNLPFSMDEAELRAEFSTFGDLVAIRLGGQNSVVDLPVLADSCSKRTDTRRQISWICPYRFCLTRGRDEGCRSL